MTVTTDQLEGLVRAHQGPLQWYLRYLGCPEADVPDLLQETFLAVLGHGPANDPRKVGAYLRTTARNLYLQKRRNDQRRPTIDDSELVEQVWVEFDRGDGGDSWLQALQSCLALLSEDARQALQLRYGQGQSRQQLATHLNRRPGGIKILLERSKRYLRECVQRRLA